MALPLWLKQWADSRTGESPLILTHSGVSDVTEAINAIAAAVVGEHTAAHPDVLIWQPETATITIKAVREVLAKLQRTPLHGQHFVAITNIEKLSLAAANALLKSLEEPSATTKWLLLTAYPRQLLPTILSRCQVRPLPASLVGPETAENLPADEQELRTIFANLQQRLAAEGPTPELRRSYLRLRDYYMIKSRRGNTKLARDILELSVPFKL